MGAFVKLVTLSGIPATELVFIRATVQGLVVVLAMGCFREIPSTNQIRYDPSTASGGDDDNELLQERSRPLLISVPLGSADIRAVVLARGAVGGCGFCLYFYTISVLPLGDAVALLSLSPVVTVWATAVFFREPMRRLHVISAITTLVGSVLIAQPNFLFGSDEVSQSASAVSSAAKSSGYVTAALGTCTSAGVFLLMRKAGKVGAHTLQLLFSWVVFGILFSFLLGVVLPLGKGGWRMPSSPQTWANIAGCCCFGMTAHFCLNFAGRHSNPGLASIVRASGILWAYLLQFFLFDHVPTLWTIVGVVLVSLSLVLVSVQKLLDNPGASSAPTAEQSRLIDAPQQKEYGASESQAGRSIV
ncbi:solute carrier family 35 member G1 [Seminavis robusta]|uniref:Solute carrier family 35 member G1 n=1 Tax=Seminavis robusta TaxID=568900 RepID=A0A9N8DT28_9STRA|nr:solute carrier family 35 member G1 [Seminavis robusta]|eukprot:Sro335_g120240.1 solute carrier family 35 member G1 (359) ;mRNA; r:73709-74785